MLVAGVVFVVIGVALIVETPGTLESVGLAIVLVAMLLVVREERRRTR
jgi:drug/metabolite transporter (DMT)-like permease